MLQEITRKLTLKKPLNLSLIKRKQKLQFLPQQLKVYTKYFIIKTIPREIHKLSLKQKEKINVSYS